MKRTLIINSLIIVFITIVFFGVTQATEIENKCLEYSVVVKDSNGVSLEGRYKDDNNADKIIEVTIPQNTKVKVLYEYVKDGILLGHIKYITTITVRSDGTIIGGTSGYSSSYRGTIDGGSGYYNYYGSSGYGTGNADDPQVENDIPETSSQEGGNYGNMPDTSSQEGGNYGNMPDTSSQVSLPKININRYMDSYSTSGENNSYAEMTAGSGLDSLGSESNKYTETKKTIEVEGDIDLSKCEVENPYSLSDAINYKTKRKLMTINKDGIDLYNGPARAYGKANILIPSNTILKYTYGAVAIDEAKKDVMWAYVEYNGKKGWIYKNPQDSLVASYEMGRLLSFKSVIIKEYPVSDSKTVETLSKDIRKSFTYVYGVQDENNDEWYYIEYKGKKGWVREAAKGINAKIIVKSENGIKLYKNPYLDSGTYDILLPNNLEIDSIYKYSKKNDAFYVEYENYSGWIILEKNDNSYNFEVTYLDDDVNDPLVDLEKNEVSTKVEDIKTKKPNYKRLILILIGIISFICITLCIIIKIVQNKKLKRQIINNSNEVKHEENIKES